MFSFSLKVGGGKKKKMAQIKTVYIVIIQYSNVCSLVHIKTKYFHCKVIIFFPLMT